MRANRLVVPLEASFVEGVDVTRPFKVLLAERGRPIASQTITFDPHGRAEVGFDLAEDSRGLKVVVGPDVDDADLLDWQTIDVAVPLRRRRDASVLKLPPIRIGDFHGKLWECSRFTIHGRLTCANGLPVPGATVSASVVEGFLWWSSTHEVGTAVTDANGLFTISFTWCCGWRPHVWWHARRWSVEPALYGPIVEAMRRVPRLPPIPRPGPTPDLRIFSALGAGGALDLPVGPDMDPGVLDRWRERLVAWVPKPPDLVCPWPWCRWEPWRDCRPDLIFRATQFCRGEVRVIVDESWSDVRRDIGTHTHVSLVASDAACCLAQDDCDGEECLAFTQVCGVHTTLIGGNATNTAPATLAGYADPSERGNGSVVASDFSDRPFAGGIALHGTGACLSGIDYYEIEYRPDIVNDWTVLQTGALVPFVRWYRDDVLKTDVAVSFGEQKDGRFVYETVEHYENAHPPAQDWIKTKHWLADGNHRIAMWMSNGSEFPDGLYRFRVFGYDDASGTLHNRRGLADCSSGGAAEVCVRIDNRVVAGSPAQNEKPCGITLAHQCTDEPYTDIHAVRLIRADGSIEEIPACRGAALAPGDRVQIDFAVYDAAGHLADYDLRVYWNENLVHSLLGFGATPIPLSGLQMPDRSASGSAMVGVPAALQVGPGYRQALIGGATAPVWRGGGLRLELPAIQAFPEDCCFLLELRAT